MFAMGVGMAIKFGMVVFMLSSMMRLYAYDVLNTFANDANNSPSDVTTAADIMKDIKLEMALTTAHEAMSKLTLMKAMDGMGKKGGKKGGRKGDKGEKGEKDWDSDKEDWSSDEEGEDDHEDADKDDADWDEMDDGAELFRF